MLDLFFYFICFGMGLAVGKNRAVNIDIVDRTEYMQKLIDRAYAERDKSKKDLDFANMQIDMWQARYFNLFEQLEEEENGFGSGSDGSHEGSKRPDQLQEN
jgi:hypothetical protein